MATKNGEGLNHTDHSFEPTDYSKEPSPFFELRPPKGQTDPLKKPDLFFLRHIPRNTLGEKANSYLMTAAIQEVEATDKGINIGATPETVSSERSRRASPTPQKAKIVNCLALADIAADLEAEIKDIQKFLEEQEAYLVNFGGTIIVPESEAIVAYEHYSVIRARQKMQERFALHSTRVEEKPQAKVAKNTTPKESSKPKKPTLTFKKQFKVNRSNYKRTMQNFLNAMFPDNEAEQKKALSDILQPNEIGGAYLEKIVRAGDYKDKQHARDLLYKAAAELQSVSDNAAPKEDGVEA